MKNVMSEKELDELKQQKKQFILECKEFEEEVYQSDKGLNYYSQITLYKFCKLIEFGKNKLEKEDFEMFSELLKEQNNAIFEEYGRLNYLYYELGKTKQT